MIDIWNKLTARERIILCLVGVIAIASLGYNFIIEPLFRQHIDANHKLGLIKMKLHKSLDLIRKKNQIDTEFASYAQKLTSHDSSEQELTYILDNIEMIARNANIKIVTMSPRPVQEKEFYKRFIVEIDAESDMSSLMRFIHDIKNSALLLKIDRLNLNTKSGRQEIVIQATMVISRIVII